MAVIQITDVTQKLLQDWQIKDIIFDSREAKEATIFCALVGIHTDGHRFIKQAKARGSRHFLISNLSFMEDNDEDVYILCDDTKRAMARLASIFYDAPSKKMCVIGVTGTDGKSTTSQLIMQLLEAMGHPCGLLSTVNLKVDKEILPNNLRQSTPESPQIEAALATMVNNGLKYAVVEATSHGLAEETGRLAEIIFQAGVFTNVTIEHLEFHQTVERYREDKANLFRKVAQNQGVSVVNALSEHAPIYINAAGNSKILLYGDANSYLWASEIEAVASGFYLQLNTSNQSERVHLPLVGRFNIENTLGALAVVSSVLGVSALDVAKHLDILQAPAGRMVMVQQEPFRIIIDYAHTPGAFESLFPQMRETTQGKIIVMFGSGGERNLEKRPIQGRLADEHTDVIILTNEDPRLEDEFVILNDIAKGIIKKELNKSFFIIPDRKRAIEHAINLCEEGDTLLLLGKGHEQSIIGPLGKMPWDEMSVVEEILQNQGGLYE